MKILIDFHDNDFQRTFEGILEIIRLANNEKICQTDTELNLTKEQWCEVINKISYGMYLLYQNLFEYENDSTEKYLKITTDRIYLNEEVDKFIQDGRGGNYSTFVYDSTLDYENNRCVFSF